MHPCRVATMEFTTSCFRGTGNNMKVHVFSERLQRRVYNITWISDASESAYAGVVYIRGTNLNSTILGSKIKLTYILVQATAT